MTALRFQTGGWVNSIRHTLPPFRDNRTNKYYFKSHISEQHQDKQILFQITHFTTTSGQTNTISNHTFQNNIRTHKHYFKSHILEHQDEQAVFSEHIKYKVACMCFSAINGPGPAYLSELLHVYTPSHTLRSSSDTNMLKIQQYKRKMHGFHTFSCFGPHI